VGSETYKNRTRVTKFGEKATHWWHFQCTIYSFTSKSPWGDYWGFDGWYKFLMRGFKRVDE